MIEFDSVSKIFGNGTKALTDVNFSLEEGEFVIIQGKSGAGKTTIARLIIKEFPFEKGVIKVDGDDISKISPNNTPLLRRKIGVAFQDFKILTNRTVRENISLALDILGLDQEIINKRIKELLNLTGLEGKDDMFPSQLSGGEVQRVIIARALAPQPKVIFADEPTGNLDEETAMQIINLLKDINEQGTAVILATHDKSVLSKLKFRSIQLEDGKIIKDTGAKKKPKKIASDDEKKKEQAEGLTPEDPEKESKKEEKPQDSETKEESKDDKKEKDE